MPNLKQPFFSIKEVAAILNVTEKSVRRWIKAKQLPAFKVGGIVRISRIQLKAFLLGRANDRSGA